MLVIIYVSVKNTSFLFILPEIKCGGNKTIEQWVTLAWVRGKFRMKLATNKPGVI
jgi:hypothetical protein